MAAASTVSPQPRQHLEQRFIRRIVWGSAASSIRAGRALSALGVSNGHHRVLRQFFRLPSAFRHQRSVEIAESIERINGVKCRVYIPKKQTSETEDETCKIPVVIYLHGGGWCSGSSKIYHHFTFKLCQDTNMIVVSVDYRLAPECPYPAGLDDCVEIVRNFTLSSLEMNLPENLRNCIDRERVLLAGDSAGGNLTGAVSLELIRQGEMKLKGAVMICPVTQAVTTKHESAMKNSKRYGKNGLGWFVSIYAGVKPSKKNLKLIHADQHLPWDVREQLLETVSDGNEIPAPTEIALTSKDAEKLAEFATCVRAWPMLADLEHLAQVRIQDEMTFVLFFL